MKIFEKVRKTGEAFSYPDRTGNVVSGTRDVSDVLLAGKVCKTRTGTTSKGNLSYSITLDGSAFDSDMGIEITEDDIFVNFYDTAYNDYATRAEKMNVQEGTFIAIKATVTYEHFESGEERITYAGNRLYYPGSKIEFRDTNAGPGAWIIFGYANLNEKNVGIPINGWNTTQKMNYTFWVNVTDLDDIIPDNIRECLEKNEEGKSKLALFVLDRDKYSETLSNTGSVTAATGNFKACYTLS